MSAPPLGREPTFVLGVGAPKAGTTWLHRYLTSLPVVAQDKIKEYHHFDTHAEPARFGSKVAKQEERLAELLAKRAARGDRPSPKLDHAITRAEVSVKLRREPERYLDHFRELLARQPGTRAVVDITPSYGALGPVGFDEIERTFEDSGFSLRIVFLLRDPVDRLISSARHTVRVATNRGFPVAPVVELIGKYYDTDFMESRTRYEQTLAQLDGRFPPSQVHVEFYERLFTPTAVERLTRFLGVTASAAPFDERINASTGPVAVPADVITRVRQHYDATYRFCMDRFGEDLIRELWRYA